MGWMDAGTAQEFSLRYSSRGGGATCAEPAALVAPGKLQESFRSAIPAEAWWGAPRSQRLPKGG